MIRVVLIAGLTNGGIVHRYLANSRNVDLVLTITNPDGFHGPRHVVFPDSPRVVKSGSANAEYARIEASAPDLIVVAGWSELLDDRILAVSKGGAVGFHPSLLPAYRGRSVLAWQIEDGIEASGLTMFYYDRLPDAGDIVGRWPIRIEHNDYIADVLDKCDAATESLMRAYFPLVRRGMSPRTPQAWGDGTLCRLRDARDSRIDWNRNAVAIYNKVRAISAPYPGAEAVIDGREYKIWRAEVVRDFPYSTSVAPGTLVATLHDGSMVVRCRDHFLRVTDHSTCDVAT